MRKKIRVVTGWITIIWVAIYFLRPHFIYIYNARNICYNKSIFHNIYLAYKHYPTGPPTKTYGTDECPRYPDHDEHVPGIVPFGTSPYDI